MKLFVAVAILAAMVVDICCVGVCAAGMEDDLIKAANSGDIKMLSRILDRGQNIDTKDTDGWTALMYASEAGRMDIMKLLLNNGAKLEVRDKAGNTALNFASREGNTEALKLLVDRGANIHSKNDNGLDPLMGSASVGSLESVELLLNKGANYNLCNKEGDPALILAARGGFQEIVNLLISSGARVPADGPLNAELITAAISGDLERARKTVEKGADVSAKTRGSGSSARLLASALGHTSIVEFLMDRESAASPKPEKNPGKAKRPDEGLLLASQNGRLETVNFLVGRGMDPNFKSKSNETPLTLAGSKGHSLVAVTLLENNAQIEAKKLVGQHRFGPRCREWKTRMFKDPSQKGGRRGQQGQERQDRLDVGLVEQQC